MSHLACSQFRPNFWRPTICAYCYRPNTKHRRTEGSSHNRGTIRGSSDNMSHDDWEFESIQRSATISEYCVMCCIFDSIEMFDNDFKAENQ